MLDQAPKIPRSHECLSSSNVCNCGSGYGWAIYVLMEVFDDITADNLSEPAVMIGLKQRALQALVEVFGEGLPEEIKNFRAERHKKIEIVPAGHLPS